MILDGCALPIVLAPLAGGPSTPELTAAVSAAGGLGFLAAGYLSAAQLAERRQATRALTELPYGINLFVPSQQPAPANIQQFAQEIAADARSVGASPGEPTLDDDDWDAKLEALLADPVPVVSFTFGLPDPQIVRELQAVGTEVWITVSSVAQARAAAAAGADVLVAQGSEAGGHLGGSDDDPAATLGLIALLQLIPASVDTPLVATGGIATGAGIAAVLSLGARAAALGTAFLSCPEAGTAQVHRDALSAQALTAYTRAFTGRTARGIVNGFLERHSATAPAAYPQVHHLTAPMRQAARKAGRADLVNLWAGQSYPVNRSMPAGELVQLLAAETRHAVDRAATVLGRPATGSY